MKNIKNLFGVKIFKSKIFIDSRGYLTNLDNLKKVRNFFPKRQIITFSKKNTLRGIHFKSKNKEAKVLTVAKGKIFEVVVDNDKQSKTYKKHFTFILDYKNFNQIYLPKNVAHGYYVMSKEALILYSIDRNYEPKYESSYKWNDKSLNIKWPKGKKKLSNKDK